MAVSDPTGTIARPLRAIERIDSNGGQAFLERVIAQEAPDLILVGDPRLMSGEVGEQAERARAFADKLRQRVNIPVQMMDERLTTVEAKRRRDETASRTSVDSLAACVMLDAYLGAQ